jgi:exodeoxyribonuclease V beta subunit
MSLQVLDALNCPLAGVNLIEASAGTGKTWTIAALYLRLLLEDVDGEAPPGIDSLLVVTYTKAATAELRERLRQQLSDFLAVLQGEPTNNPFLQALADRFAPGSGRDLAIQRLQAAISGFDAAAIYTIHGFCQRVLTDAAFESGQTFAAELVSDDDRLLVEVVDDFWRQRVVTSPLLSQVLAEAGETPDGWLAEIRPWLAKPYLQVVQPVRTICSRPCSRWNSTGTRWPPTRPPCRPGLICCWLPRASRPPATARPSWNAAWTSCSSGWPSRTACPFSARTPSNS